MQLLSRSQGRSHGGNENAPAGAGQGGQPGPNSRPVALRHLRQDTGAGASYLDTLPGRRVAAQGAITGDAGTLAVDGDTWSARVEPGAPEVAPGDEVTVLRIDGATLVVRPLPRIDWEADGA
nr:NfeD family protein [Micrococcus sp. HSID17245]